jgi:hypothetical protein
MKYGQTETLEGHLSLSITIWIVTPNGRRGLDRRAQAQSGGPLAAGPLNPIQGTRGQDRVL